VWFDVPLFANVECGFRIGFVWKKVSRQNYIKAIEAQMLEKVLDGFGGVASDNSSLYVLGVQKAQQVNQSWLQFEVFSTFLFNFINNSKCFCLFLFGKLVDVRQHIAIKYAEPFSHQFEIDAWFRESSFRKEKEREREKKEKKVQSEFGGRKNAVTVHVENQSFNGFTIFSIVGNLPSPLHCPARVAASAKPKCY
jgi:hypothetical protein